MFEARYRPSGWNTSLIPDAPDTFLLIVATSNFGGVTVAAAGVTCALRIEPSVQTSEPQAAATAAPPETAAANLNAIRHPHEVMAHLTSCKIVRPRSTLERVNRCQMMAMRWA